MSYFVSKLLAGSLLIIASVPANADPFHGLFNGYGKVMEEGKVSHSVDIDNDTLLLNRNDGFYTSGLRYTQTRMLKGDDQETVTFGWRFGQELYTASDIKLPPELIGPPNHPYAGWLFGGLFKETRRADGTHAKIGIDIGCLGHCAGGEWTQTQFHRVLNQPLPRGWSKQVKNELGMVLYGEVAPVQWALHPSVDVTPSINARFGNIFTDIGASLLTRAGQLRVVPDQSRVHAYLRMDIHSVAYNATLQGGYFSKNNPHTMDPKRVVGEAEAGFAWNYGPYAAKMAIVRRSNEIKDLPSSIGAQNYLHLQFAYTP